MSGKFVIAVLLVFYVGQVFPATVQTSSQHPSTRFSINDIINQLNILISQTSQSLSELSKLIDNLDNRVLQIVSVVDLPGTLQELWDQVDTIIQQAGVNDEEADGCIHQRRKAASSLSIRVTRKFNQCLQIVDPKKNYIVEQVAKIRAYGGDMITAISNGISHCYRNYPSNPADLLASLRPLQAQAIQQTDALESRIHALLTDDKALINQMAEQLEPCVRSVQLEARQWQQDILQEIRLCVVRP